MHAVNADDSNDIVLDTDSRINAAESDHFDAGALDICPFQATRKLQSSDVLIFPLSKSAVSQYFEEPGAPPELRIFYGTKEICFDDPAQFAFGEALAKQSRFLAGDAVGWGDGEWPRVSEMLEELIEHEVLRYADDDVMLALAIDREDQASPLPPAEIDEPPSWDDFENVMHRLTGSTLEISYLELVVPIFRVAHMYMDADGRQLGEANVFPPALRLDQQTQWRTCTYPGTRYQPDRPMNVTALKVMRVHWRQMMAVLLHVREAYLKRFPDARKGWTVGDIERMSVVVLAMPSFMLLRAENPVENGKLHPVLSSIFRVTDGLRMTMHQMLFVPFGEPTRKPDTPMTGAEVFAYAERNHSLHSGHGVCAGPQFMIEEFLAVLLDGAEPKSGMPRAIDPEVQAALDHLDDAFDYGMLGLQAFGTIFSLWPGMTDAYHDLFLALDNWSGEKSPKFHSLHLRFKGRADHLASDTYLATRDWRDDRVTVYDDMYAKCVFGQTGKYPIRSLRERLTDFNIADKDPLIPQITDKFIALLSDIDSSNLLAQQLSSIFIGFIRRTQATLKLAEEIQSNTNSLLGRPTPKFNFSAQNLNLHTKMQGEGETALPYLIDEIGSILGIIIDIDSIAVSISNVCIE